MRKIIAIILICMLFIPSFSVNAEEYKSFEDEKLFFLESLNITDGIQKEMTEFVTRAEFTAMVVRAVKLDILAFEQVGFDDVDKANPFVKEIYAAKATRIANGTSQTTFSPDEPIIYEAACKELVVALGYEHKAEYLGSYPSGYFRVASELDFGNGVTNDNGMLTFGDAVTMIYNALYTPVMMQSGVKGDGIIYDIAGTPLTVCFKLKSINGVVSTAGFISDTSIYTGHNVLEISGNVFKCDFNAERYFGKSVVLWYDARGNVAAIDENQTNKEIKIDVNEISGFSNNVLSVFDSNNREIKYKFDPGFAFIKNGKYISHNELDFITSSGEARLVDNNSDNMYDYYILDAKEYFVVRSLNYADKTIYDSNSYLKSINLQEDNDRSVEILKYDKQNNTYTEVGFDEIIVGTAVEVIQSDDKTVCKLIIFEDSELSGVVSEIGDKEITVNDSVYKLNHYFIESGKTLTVGTKYNFVVAPDNTITDIKFFSNDEIKYGFTLGFGKGSGLLAESKMKLLTTDNLCQIYTLADTVKLNGVNKKKDDAVFELEFKNGEYPVYSLIRYRLNENGEICMIDTAVSSVVDKNLSSAYNENDSLMCYSEKSLMVYKMSGAMAIPNYVLSNSIIFTVPTELSTNSQKHYDSDCFRIGSIVSMMNDKEYAMSAYDLNDVYYPQVVVVYSNESDADNFELPNENALPFMVADITDSVDDDGERVKKLYGVSNGIYVEYYMPMSLVNKLTTDGKMPSKGDIVRISASGKRLRGLTRDISATSTGVVIDYTENGVSKAANSLVTYIGGELVAKDNGAIVLEADQKPNLSSGAYVNNIAPVPLGNPSYTVCDMKTGEIYPAKNESLQALGERKQYVVCHLQYYRALNVYIYIE